MQATALADPGLAGCERLRPGQIYVWEVDLAAKSAESEPLWLLSDEERGRAARLIDAERRRWFVRAHVILRRVLAGYVGIPPERLTFATGAFGKPRLAGGAPQALIDFNMSHSGERLLIAVTAGAPVGVDVEALRRVPDALAIARRHFARGEYEALAALAAEEHERAFLACWTRKEAVMKAHGGGIGLGLADVLTSFAPLGVAGLEVRAGGSSFRVRDVGSAGYVGAIACTDRIGEVVRRVLP